jgi:excisionase family DNA binding protein
MMMITKEEMIGAGLQRVSQAAQFLGISRSKIYELMNEGRLPYVLIGRSRRVPIMAVQALALENLIIDEKA